MTKIKINIDIEKQGALFLFYINIFNISEETIKLNLSNNSGGLVREAIVLYDKNKNKLDKGVSYMTPLINDISLTSIEIGESTQFVLKARLEEIENHLFLEFKGANFNVKKDETYYFQMEYLNAKSNTIAFIIN